MVYVDAIMTDAWQLQNPDLIFRADGTPFSRVYEDIYYQGEGLAETEHVFINGIGGPAVWADQRHFVIAEIGFGTGLNFLATWARWRATAPAHGRLHYVAVDRAPIAADVIRHCHHKHPSLASLVRELCAYNLNPSPGFHRFWLDQSRVSLTLLLGEAAAVLSAAEAGRGVDAWYLDGFAPSRNPAAWHGSVFAEIARLSKPAARLATYSAASVIRKQLSEVGFTVQKRPGFGRKRDMICATYTAHKQPISKPSQSWLRMPNRPPPSTPVAIIGGGIAGAAMAAALQRRGLAVNIFERRPQLAAEATAVPAGLIAPPPNLGRTAIEAFQIAAFRYQLETVRPFAGDSPRGVVFWPDDMEHGARLSRLISDQGPARGLFEKYQADRSAAVIAPQAGMVAGDALARQLLAGAETATSKTVIDLRLGLAGWQLIFEDGSRVDAETVILANAGAAAALSVSNWLPLHLVRGQMAAVSADSVAAPMRQGHIGDGYLTPEQAGRRYLGTTFDHQGFTAAQWPQPVVDRDHRRLLAKAPLGAQAADIPAHAQIIDGWAGLRAFSQDRAPVVGPLPDQAAFLQAFARLRHGDRRAKYPEVPPYLPGLYVLAGLGARGLTLAPLAAELLAAQIMAEPWPVPRPQAEALAPVRFLARALIRGSDVASA